MSTSLEIDMARQEMAQSALRVELHWQLKEIQETLGSLRTELVTIRQLQAEIERLRAEREDYKDVADDLGKFCQLKDAEIERLEAHKRAQAEDIMTLGQQVGKLEAEIERLAGDERP
jgi:uncharacterized small protein (DUF1192 family)